MNIEFAKQVLKAQSLADLPFMKMKIDWFGFDFQLELSRKKLFVHIDTSKPSQLKRYRYLPRTSTAFRFERSQFSFKSAPLIETLSNLQTKPFTWQKLNEVAKVQLSEIELAKAPQRLRPPAKKSPQAATLN